MGDPFSAEPSLPEPEEQGNQSGSMPAQSAAEARRRGDQLMRAGRFEEAFRYYRQAIQLESHNIEHYLHLGDAYAYADQPARALAFYQRARKLNPRDPEPYFALAEIYRRFGRFDAALAHYRKAIEYGARNAFVLFKYAETLAVCQQYAEAIEVAREAVNCEPSNGFFRFWLADLLERYGEVAEAMLEMEIATLLNPEDDYYHFRYGLLCLENEYPEKAIESIQAALRIQPHNAVYLTVLGDIYRLLGEMEEAMKVYQQAGELDSYDIAELERARRLGGIQFNGLPDEFLRRHYRE